MMNIPQLNKAVLNILSQVEDLNAMLDGKVLRLKSSTPDSDKVFLITVDDSGTITATEET